MQRRTSVSSAGTPTKRTTFSADPPHTEPAADADTDKRRTGLLQRLHPARWLQDVTRAEWDVLVVATCLKLLLFPA